MPEDKKKVAGLDTLAADATRAARNFDEPPLHLWNPPLSGAIDIVIRADGSWWHEGVAIQRDSIVRLFAAILRREEDGEYYLVTPAEKWQLKVESHPLIITGLSKEGSPSDPAWYITTNTGRRFPVDIEHPLAPDKGNNGVAVVQLPHGLSAICSRPVWYQLVATADTLDGVLTICSAGSVWPLE